MARVRVTCPEVKSSGISRKLGGSKADEGRFR
jgi:hypothetical protein